MSIDNEIEIINELTEISGKNTSFEGDDNVNKLHSGIEKLFYSNKEIAATWTHKKFGNNILDLVRRLKSENRKCLAEDVRKLHEALLNVPIQESEVLFEFYGAEMSQAQIKFGEFTIYNYELSKTLLIDKYPELNEEVFSFNKGKPKHLIGIKVKARENDKAVEIAKGLCEVFENVFSYMISDLRHINSVGIFKYRGWSSVNYIVCGNESTVGFENNIAMPVKIDHPIFKDPKAGNDKIWNLITKQDKTVIEKRIINSIEWIGKAVHELDLSKSLVQFVFAIESMLQFNSGTPITPSIVSQLSDWLAFVIHDNLEERKRIASFFKDIYGKRSAIAHGASKTINIQDLHLAKQLSKSMIQSFLTTKPFCEMKTMNELNNHLTDLKFK